MNFRDYSAISMERQVGVHNYCIGISACNISDLSVSPQSPTVNLFPIESDLVLPREGSCYFCNCTNSWLLCFSIFTRYCKQH